MVFFLVLPADISDLKSFKIELISLSVKDLPLFFGIIFSTFFRFFNSLPNSIFSKFFTFISKLFLFISNPYGFLPSFLATLAVVKLPKKKSHTLSFSFDEYMIIFFNNSSGNLFLFFTPPG